jgi:hypothetical protein
LLLADGRKHWLGETSIVAWSPRCKIVVHPSTESYVRYLGPGSEQTSGCATVHLDRGRVVERRIDLRADAIDWKTESLPHELTHILLADRFSTRQIPSWADEGMAMLAESPGKLRRRLAELRRIAATGALYRTQDLVGLQSGPPPKYLRVFYGQSVSLVAFLLEQGTPAQLVRFVEVTQTSGPDAALAEVYHLHSWPMIEQGWKAYVATDRMLTRSRQNVTASAPRGEHAVALD